MWAEVEAGHLPDEPTIEWYLHTTVDPSLRDAAGNHSSALFVQSVPYRPAEGPWDDVLPGYVDRLLTRCDRFAPGVRALVADTFALPPPGIEAHFGISYGHIHHVDNTIAFADRMPHATGVDGLYAGSAGATRPAPSSVPREPMSPAGSSPTSGLPAGRRRRRTEDYSITVRRRDHGGPILASRTTAPADRRRRA